MFFSILFCGISSCSKDPGPNPDLGYNYFPDQVGRYVVYTVDSFYYDASANPPIIDTIKFQIKEKIQSVYTDNEGRPTMRLERYIKYYDPLVPYSNMSWTLKDVWSQNKTLRTAEKVEENLRYIKLAFPIKEAQEWNGNAQNSQDAQNYFYAFFDQARTIGNIKFDSVLQVTQQNESSLVHLKYNEEKYARNVGLIYKRGINIESQPPSSWNSLPFGSDSLTLFFDKLILTRITSGTQYTMTVNSYGIE
ncbi:MAG: hypothetical protein K0S44_2151 [Bacteroidetes bacterium]|nr:hypothetical protein [Bacteroidota bacterium]